MRANERRVASRNERDWMDSTVARIWTFSVFFLLFLYLHVSCAVEKLSTFCVCDIVFGRLLIKFEISSRTPAHSVLHKQQEIAFAPITHSFQMSECQIIDRVSPIQPFCYTERNCFSLSLRVNEDRIEKKIPVPFIQCANCGFGSSHFAHTYQKHKTTTTSSVATTSVSHAQI